ncbi:unnamed protein product, partial [Rotaria socialis]
VCMPPAQFYHWYDVNLRMRMLGIETKKVAKMNEEAAVALGADILGEGMSRLLCNLFSEKTKQRVIAN